MILRIFGRIEIAACSEDLFLLYFSPNKMTIE